MSIPVRQLTKASSYHPLLVSKTSRQRGKSQIFLARGKKQKEIETCDYISWFLLDKILHSTCPLMQRDDETKWSKPSLESHVNVLGVKGRLQTDNFMFFSILKLQERSLIQSLQFAPTMLSYLHWLFARKALGGLYVWSSHHWNLTSTSSEWREGCTPTTSCFSASWNCKRGLSFSHSDLHQLCCQIYTDFFQKSFRGTVCMIKPSIESHVNVLGVKGRLQTDNFMFFSILKLQERSLIQSLRFAPTMLSYLHWLFARKALGGLYVWSSHHWNLTSTSSEWREGCKPTTSCFSASWNCKRTLSFSHSDLHQLCCQICTDFLLDGFRRTLYIKPSPLEIDWCGCTQMFVAKKERVPRSEFTETIGSKWNHLTRFYYKVWGTPYKVLSIKYYK